MAEPTYPLALTAWQMGFLTATLQRARADHARWMRVMGDKVSGAERPPLEEYGSQLDSLIAAVDAAKSKPTS